MHVYHWQIKQGGVVPVELYKQDISSSAKGVETFIVPRGGTYEKEILICNEKSVLK